MIASYRAALGMPAATHQESPGDAYAAGRSQRTTISGGVTVMATRKNNETAAPTGTKRTATIYARIQSREVDVELLDEKGNLFQQMEAGCGEAEEVIEALKMQDLPAGTYKLSITVEPGTVPARRG